MTPEKKYESSSDIGAMIFAVIGSVIVGVALIIPSVISYAILWLGSKAGLWIFDNENKGYQRMSQ